MALDPRQLRVLLTVVREGSFSAAAEVLHMSQPAVSMAIAQLERSVGAQLVERGRQGAKATQAGRILTRRAEMIETVIDLARREIALGMVGTQGPLIVGGTPGALISLLPPATARLEREGTRFALQVVEAADADLFEMLRTFTIDLAVCTVSLGALPQDIVERALLVDRFILAMRAGHPFPSDTATLSEVAGLEWALPGLGGAFQRQIEAMFLNAGVLVPERAIRSDSIALTKEIVRQSDHVTILPHRVIATELTNGMFRQVVLRTGSPTRTVGVRMLRERAQMPLADSLIRAMADATESIHQQS
jgi:LysR family transcriptional regulator of abg operon